MMEIMNINKTDLKIIDFRENDRAKNLVHDEQMEFIYYQDEKVFLSQNEDNFAKVYRYDINKDVLEPLYSVNKEKESFINFNFMNLKNMNYSLRNEDSISHYIYSFEKEKIIFSLETVAEEALFLNEDYILLRNSEDAYVYEETWHYHSDKDFLYLYDIKNKVKHEILDLRLKNSWLTSNNYFIKNLDGEAVLYHVPFEMDPYEAEQLSSHSASAPADAIYSISLKTLLKQKEAVRELPLNKIHSREGDEYYFAYGNNNYVLYNFSKNTMRRFRFNDNGEIEFSEKTIDYSLIASTYNFALIQDQFVYHGEGITVFLSMDMHEMEHGIRDVFLKRIGNLYVFSSWTEDNNGDNYEEFLIIRDVTGKILLKLSTYVQVIATEDILIFQ